MFARLLIPFTILATATACANYPRDVAGTLDRVKRDKVIRVGLAAPNARAAAETYVRRIAAETGAQGRFVAGATEPLLAQLEQGQLDLVIGDFATDSPWVTDVSVIEPIARYKSGKRELGLSPVARNGENAWIMLLERTSRDMKGGG